MQLQRPEGHRLLHRRVHRVPRGRLDGSALQLRGGSYFPSFTSLELVAVVVIVDSRGSLVRGAGRLGYARHPRLHQRQYQHMADACCSACHAVTAAYSTRGAPTARGRAAGAGPDRRPQPARVRPRSTAASRAAELPRREVVGRARRSCRGGSPGREGLVLQGHVGELRRGQGRRQGEPEAPMGVITGLVGPNGAGKTTLFNAASGLVGSAGAASSFTESTSLGSGRAARARKGLGRTFQRCQLFDSLTVRQNVAMGREAPLAGKSPFDQIYRIAASQSASRRIRGTALELTGTLAIADQQAGLLPTGQRRLVELARGSCGRIRSAPAGRALVGLDAHETERFGQVLRGVVEDRGVGILLVEHDMTLVRRDL